MATKQVITYDTVLRELADKQYKPVYLLMGDESYYIDAICGYIEEHVLTDVEKDFNQMVFYGRDVDASTVTNAARRFPMMAERQVVIVKEAQDMADLENLVYYMQSPMNSTILVLCYKHGTVDKRKKLVSLVEKIGIVFESKKIKETQLSAFITGYLKKKKLDIEPKAVMMLVESVGTDLSRMVGELEKLILTVSKDKARITADQVEQNIGISKEYNIFELRAALVEKDILKANMIINYYADTPKENPLPKVLATIFNFFSNLMLAYYAPKNNEAEIASWIGLKSPWAAREYMTAMRHYSGVKTMQIISAIRQADALSKGIGKGNLSDKDILRELVFFIMH